MPPIPAPNRLAILASSLSVGGIGRNCSRLANALVEKNIPVDMVFCDESPYLEQLDPRVRRVRVATTNLLTGIIPLARYLRRHRPAVMLTNRLREDLVALRARRVAQVSTRVATVVHTVLSQWLTDLSETKRNSNIKRLRRALPATDTVIAVSDSVAEDAAHLLDWPAERILALPNPIVTAEVARLAAEPTGHPWFAESHPPVILSAGRLDPAKGFDTLLHAFARVRRARPCRLVILGEGTERATLEALAQQLGIAADVDLPGFRDNPYAFMSRARVFVSASRWEGLGNALIEAMCLGRPVVATDCGGPREILQGGGIAPLVPIDDESALADALVSVMDNPPSPDTLTSASARYSVEQSAEAYIEALGLRAVADDTGD